MNTLIRTALAIATLTLIGQAAQAQIVFYEDDNFQGRSFTANGSVENFKRYGFNDRASSVVVMHERWEACDDVRFGGRCIVLRQGRYPSLGAMGMNDRISSVREVSRDAWVDDSHYAPHAPLPAYDNRRRDGEQLFQANVTAVHAVVGPPTQRCWVEQQQVMQNNDRGPNVGGALAGALIGGVLGHQVGGGTGKDLATAGGAVAGAAIGANAGRDYGQSSSTQNVQRCASAPSQARPEFWDVSYEFRGRQHQVQMASQPGPYINVNGQGEPRS
jgi:uncharacterized protein YcfJ